MDEEIQQAKIKKVLANGLMVQLHDKEGFVPRRELSWWRNPRLDPMTQYHAGQKISVVLLDRDAARYSLKRAEHDPWMEKSSWYQTELAAGHAVVVRGIVTNIWNDRVNLLLDDFNDAVLFYSGLPDELKNSKIEFNAIFASGDHIEANVKEVNYEHKNIVLDIGQRINDLYAEQMKTDVVDYSATLGSLLVASGLLPEDSQQNYSCFQNISVLIIEDSLSDREKITTTLSGFGLHHVDAPTSENECRELIRTKYFDLAFLDKNLDHFGNNLSCAEFARQLRLRFPDMLLVVTTLEDISSAEQYHFHGISDCHFISKPISSLEIEHYLTVASRGIAVSSSEAIRDLDRNAQNVSDFISSEQSLDDGLKIILRGLCDMEYSRIHAAVLHQDAVTGEFDCLCDFGTASVAWEECKSRLRDTPVNDVIQFETPFHVRHLPENRKRHFPDALLHFTSFAGIPIRTFADTTHGLFLFGQDRDAISLEVYRFAHEAAQAAGRLIERSVTAKKIAQDALFASMGRLSMAMAHDMNNLVIGLDEIPGKLRTKVEELARNQDNAEKMLPEIRHGFERLRHIGKQLREIFSFYSTLSKQDAIPEKIDLRELILESFENIVKHHCRKQQSATSIEGGQGLSVFASKVKLKQVLHNVLLNACQQQEAGRPFLHVRLNSSSASVRIEITDAGPGIHAKDWERIFEPWYTTRKEGAGMGLYICRILLRAMRGTIRVKESFRFVGTCFLIELPNGEKNEY